MKQFFRFPHTPHLAWLGTESPRDDKLLSPAEATEFLKGNVVVEEKLDGANLGISVDLTGRLQAQNRGQFLDAPYSGQFARLPSWLASHETILARTLNDHLILFGEWCTARHSLDYFDLPDWFLAFDIYDRREGKFWNTIRRNALVQQLALSPVPTVFTGQTDLKRLKDLVIHGRSRFRTGPMEGIVVRREGALWLDSRAKLVHPTFAQTIADHWSRRNIEWNRLVMRSQNPPNRH